ncbi:MAG: hypothetical protein ACYCW6_17325, partial [Candidatus Xenobia bacterium]
RALEQNEPPVAGTERYRANRRYTLYYLAATEADTLGLQQRAEALYTLCIATRPPGLEEVDLTWMQLERRGKKRNVVPIDAARRGLQRMRRSPLPS